MHLDPKHYSLGTLLQSRLFRIPDYQRAYAWETKQRTELFGDIREVHRSKQDHFMATVVALARDKRSIVADEYQVVDLVDGQQRITTLIILFKAIEKSLDAGDSIQAKIKREIKELLVKGDDHSLVLLQTNHDSSNIFADYLRDGNAFAGAPETAADKNLLDAISECEEFVSGWVSKAILIELVVVMKNRLSMIYHELSDEASVYRVFEVLNSRGLDVKWVDKLKSQLMALIFTHVSGDARTEALNEMRVIWRDIYRILGVRAALGDEALRFAGTMAMSWAPRKLLNEAEAATNLTALAGTDLKSIVEIAQWLKKVVAAIDSLDRNHRLRAVSRIVQARFVAVAILLGYSNSKSQQRLMTEWERITFRIYGLGNADKRHRVGEYVSLGHEIINKKPKEDSLCLQLRALGGAEFAIDEVLDGRDWSESYIGWTEELRYLLFRYEEQLAARSGEKLNASQWNKIWSQEPSKSIEHIKAQSSGVSYMHHLGNLTMLPPGVNSSLKDKVPAAKAQTYEGCGLRVTAEVGRAISEDGWSKETVVARCEDIVKFIRKEWAD